MKSYSSAFYIFLCLCQSIPCCYALIEKDVYGGLFLSIFFGVFVSFVPILGQFLAAPGLEFMTGVPAMLFFIPLMILLLASHITGGVKGAWSILDKHSAHK